MRMHISSTILEENSYVGVGKCLLCKESRTIRGILTLTRIFLVNSNHYLNGEIRNVIV